MKRQNAVFLSVAAAIVSMMGWSKTVYLDKSSTNPVAPYNSWATAANDPATAFAAANSGNDVINVAPDVYAVSEELHMSAGGVTVQSCDKTTGAQDPEHTVFDGSGIVSSGTATTTAGSSILRPNNSVRLKGLTFRNGRAATEGGALYFKDWLGASKIENCCFENNAATVRGGAIYFHVGNHGTVITNCVFDGNAVTATTAAYQGGGAIFNNDNQPPYIKIVDCVASNNTSSGVHPYGGCYSFANPAIVRGGYYLNNSNATVTSGQMRGGAIWTGKPGSVISGATFEGACQAMYGAVIHAGSSTVISNCTLKNLTGSVNYGVIHTEGNVTVADCRLLNSRLGSAFCFQESSYGTCLRNCLVANGNTRLFYGFLGGGTVDHCTFYGNTVLPLDSNTNGQTLVRNSLLDFTGTQPAASGTYTYVISNSYLTTAVSGAVTSGNIVGGATGVKVTPTGDCALRADSPLLDKGLELDWTAAGRDLAGNPRTVGAAPDMGCLERQGTELDYQRAVAHAEERTGAWADAFVGARGALESVGIGYDLLFKSGTYAIDQELSVNARSIGLQAESDGSVVFDAQGNGRCLNIRTTGEGQSVTVRGIQFVNGHLYGDGEGTEYGRGAGVCANSGYATSRITFSHCLISNCLTECLTAYAGHGRGGGLHAWGYVTVEDSTVADCCASNALGGGAHIETASTVPLGEGALVRRCAFLRNRTYRTTGVGESGNGGGVSSMGKVWFEDCDFRDNTSADAGGGLYLGADAWVVGSRIADNAAGSSGAVGYTSGGVVSNCVITGTKSGYCLFSYSRGPLVTHTVFSNNLVACYICVGAPQTFRNCLFVEPLAAEAVFLNQGSAVVTLENCTFVNCACGVNVWGYGGGNVQASLKNCLFANNVKDYLRQPDCKSNPSFIFTNCYCSAAPTFDQYTATGMVYGTNPGFVDAAHGDWRIKAGSKCRDKGVMLDWMNAAAVDLNGSPRVVTQGVPLAADPNALPDIGCYECQVPVTGMLLIIR